MAKDLTKYQDQLGRLQGAEYFFFKTAADGGFTFFGDVDTTADQVLMGLVANAQVNPRISATATGFSISITTPYGTYGLAASTGQSLLSLKLPIARKGAILRLDFEGFVGDANISLMAGSAGGYGSLETLLGTNISTIMYSASGALLLAAKENGLWAIVDAGISATVQAAA